LKEVTKISSQKTKMKKQATIQQFPSDKYWNHPTEEKHNNTKLERTKSTKTYYAVLNDLQGSKI
jgi:hypothetical protein